SGGSLLFTKDAWSGLADGTITVTFRTWTKPQAKPGGRYRTAGLLLEVDAIERVDARSISDADARRPGYPSAQALRSRLDNVSEARGVWGVEFRCLGADDRIVRRNDASLDDEKLAKLKSRLDRMDRASGAGPWTQQTLRLIASHPGVVSTVLARRINM